MGYDIYIVKQNTTYTDISWYKAEEIRKGIIKCNSNNKISNIEEDLMYYKMFFSEDIFITAIEARKCSANCQYNNGIKCLQNSEDESAIDINSQGLYLPETIDAFRKESINVEIILNDLFINCYARLSKSYGYGSLTFEQPIKEIGTHAKLYSNPCYRTSPNCVQSTYGICYKCGSCGRKFVNGMLMK